MLKYYPAIVHEDGLETAILGLDMEVTQLTFYDGQNTLTSGPNHDSSSMMLKLRCRSEVATVDFEADATETHHQKSAVHTSLGYLFYSGVSRQSGSNLVLLVVCLSVLLAVGPIPLLSSGSGRLSLG